MLELIWPSKKKVKSLRLEGVSLFSTAFFRTILLLSVIFILTACATSFAEFFSRYLAIAADPSKDPIRIQEIGKLAWESILFPTLIIAALGYAAILLSTKFLFNPGLATLQLSRCSWRSNKHRTNLWRLGFELILLFSGLIIISASMMKIFPELLSALSYPLEDANSGFYTKLLEIRNFIILILSLLLPLIFLLNWFTYNLQYRMSKEELMAEASNSDKNSIGKI